MTNSVTIGRMGALVRHGSRLALLGLCSACHLLESAKPEQFRTVIRVESDPGVAVVGAEVLWNETVAARTDDTGTAQLELSGRDGDSFALMIRCPSE